MIRGKGIGIRRRSKMSVRRGVKVEKQQEKAKSGAHSGGGARTTLENKPEAMSHFDLSPNTRHEACACFGLRAG
jgi:hypothetical protein